MRNDPDTGARAAKPKSVEVEIITKRWGSNSSSSVKVIDATLIGDSAVRLDITVDLRKTDTIQIRPVRRDLDDIEGIVKDAQKLANG